MFENTFSKYTYASNHLKNTILCYKNQSNKWSLKIQSVHFQTINK